MSLRLLVLHNDMLLCLDMFPAVRLLGISSIMHKEQVSPFGFMLSYERVCSAHVDCISARRRLHPGVTGRGRQ